MLYLNNLEQFSAKNRHWQGIPSIERTPDGKLFAAFYSGGRTEEMGNYCVVIQSGDEGETWSQPIAVSYAGENRRCYDPCLWIDTIGRLWFFWSLMPEFEVWAAVCNSPDAPVLAWETPRKIGEDVMMNKPTVLSNGTWLFPIAVWRENLYVIDGLQSNHHPRLAFAYSSTDNGDTIKRLGGVDMEGRWYDEHMFLELNCQKLAMYVRTSYGIGVSYSSDGGMTWTKGEDTGFKGPNSRFFIRRLSSGNILLINHLDYTGRNNLTAMLSTDEGKTWDYKLLLDERSSVSYPDAVESNGFIYIVYDRERGATYDNSALPAKEILLAKITEKDIRAGSLTSPGSKLKSIVSKL